MRCGAFTRYCRNIGFQINEVFSAIFYLKTDFTVDYLTNQAKEYRSFALGFSKVASLHAIIFEDTYFKEE